MALDTPPSGAPGPAGSAPPSGTPAPAPVTPAASAPASAPPPVAATAAPVTAPVVPVVADADAVTGAVFGRAAKFGPWAAAWWVALLQGLIVAGLGVLYMLNPGEFRAALLQFLTLFLLIMGLIDLMVGLAQPRTTRGATLSYLRGLVGFVGGLVLLSMLFLGVFATRAGLGQTLFGVVAIAYGVLGLLVAFTKSAEQGRTSAIVGGGIFTLFGVAMLIPSVDQAMASWVGPALVILGVGLVVYAFIRRSRTKEKEAAA